MWALLLLLFLSPVHPPVKAESDSDQIRQAYETGEQALKQGDLVAAKRSFLRVLTLVPEDVGARVNLGVVSMRENQWDQALVYLRQAETRAPHVVGIRLNIGLAEYRKGDYAAAIPVFASVLHDQPGSGQARRLLGQSYLFEERYADAAQTLEPLWPESNGDMSYLYSLAVAAGNARQKELEEKSLARLMEVGKDSPLLHLLNGKAYLAREDFDRAQMELQSAAEADEKLPLVHYNLGVVYRRQGHMEEARKEFLRDVALEPAVPFNYDQLGVICLSLQQTNQAESYYREALKHDPALGTSWFGLAKIYRQERRYPEALKAIDKANSIDSKSASAHYLRAQILTEIGRGNEAKNEMAMVRTLKRESLDKLEQQVSSAVYRDPEVAQQGQVQAGKEQEE